jgi:hypothetical protein
MGVKTPSCKRKAAIRLRISNWYSRKAEKLVGTTQTFSHMHSTATPTERMMVGLARARGDWPAARMTVSSRSPERR